MMRNLERLSSEPKQLTMKSYNEGMISLGDKNYIIDLEKYTNIVSNGSDNDMATETETEKITTNDAGGQKSTSTSVMTREYEKTQVIDGPKYDVLRMCLEVLLTYNEEIDETLGFERALASTTIPFKIACSTLLGFGVLTEIDEE